MRRAALVFAAFLFASQAALPAEDQIALATKSKSMHAHWSCSVLAGQMGRKDEQSRHFGAGRRDGEVFYAALLDGSLPRSTYNLHAELSVLGFLDGPNPDFAMGRYYEHIKQKIFSHLRTEPSETDAGEVIRGRAHMQYLGRNCELLP